MFLDITIADGNLVYEVQVDVPDDRCSMRGFDKGKVLDDGSLRPTHVADYLATIEQDPAHTELSAKFSKDLKKRGFKFVGPTIVYAWMQAVGMVNDHSNACFRRKQVKG